MYEAAQAAGTKCHIRAAWTTETSRLPSGDWTSTIQVPAGLVSSEASLLGWQMPPLCVLMAFPLHPIVPGPSAPISSS